MRKIVGNWAVNTKGIVFLGLFLLGGVEGLHAKGKHPSGKPTSTSVKKEISSEIKQAENTAAQPYLKHSNPLIAAAYKIDTVAKQLIIIDFASGKVLYEKNADLPMHPSSMTKIMTAYLAFDRLKKGGVSLETTVPVSQRAWRMGGSRMFINVNSQVSINDLLHGIVIQSGNDACVALAEGLSGSEEVFAAEMTQKAQEIGCMKTVFRNASGWPDPEHLTTARDLATIAISVIKEHPEYYYLFSKTEYAYNKITQPNRNPLLDKNIGCDGLKTGFTDAGGYGLAATAKKIMPQGNEMRIVMVGNGWSSQRERATESLKLMTWAMNTFTTLTVAKKGQILANMDVAAGAERTVGLTILKDAYITLPQVVKDQVKKELIFDRSIQAPIKEGQVLGKIRLTGPTLEEGVEINLVAVKAIERANVFKRLWNSITHIFGG